MSKLKQTLTHDLKHPHTSDSKKRQMVDTVLNDRHFDALLRRNAKPGIRQRFRDTLESEEPFPKDVYDKITKIAPNDRQTRITIAIVEMLQQIRKREASQELVSSGSSR